MTDPHRKPEVHYLWQQGLGLLLEREPGERFPCDGLTDLFFPDMAVGRPRLELNRKVRQAIELCRTCHRIDECQRLAHERKERFGVWGGQWFYRIYGLGRFERVDAKRRSDAELHRRR
jgi:hypothetical protein